MEHWTNVWWKVLGLSVLGSIIATYVVRLLEWAGPLAWAGLTSHTADTVVKGVLIMTTVAVIITWVARWGWHRRMGYFAHA
ncbi:MAG TPA: hypothetical protein VFT50_01430 [Baekduia sp.]|nr:hypothetical protein [Baekduia sp.]